MLSRAINFAILCENVPNSSCVVWSVFAGFILTTIGVRWLHLQFQILGKCLFGQLKDVSNDALFASVIKPTAADEDDNSGFGSARSKHSLNDKFMIHFDGSRRWQIEWKMLNNWNGMSI
jgi:hypothetical protein